MTYTYPKNSIYRGGAYNNDAMTKIFTQKYIAQVPWLPEEAWSDHRRIGLPFFENQAVEKDYNPLNQVPLTVATSKECLWNFIRSVTATRPISRRTTSKVIIKPLNCWEDRMWWGLPCGGI